MIDLQKLNSETVNYLKMTGLTDGEVREER